MVLTEEITEKRECIYSKPCIIVFGRGTDARTRGARSSEKTREGSASDIKEEALGIISWIVFGLIAGIIAKLLMLGQTQVDASLPCSSESRAPSSGDSYIGF